MKSDTNPPPPPGGGSKAKIALGAAGLLLFIMGVRRSFRSDSGAGGENPERSRERKDRR